MRYRRCKVLRDLVNREAAGMKGKNKSRKPVRAL